MTATQTGTSTWQIDPAHSGAEFSVRHMMISTVKGQLAISDGTIVINETNHTATSVKATIGVGSISTRDEKRDGHLKSGDFFDAEKWPTITFRSTNVEKLSDTKWKVYGDLTIRDTTNPIDMEVEEGGEITDPYGKRRRGFTGETTINRKDFGLAWNAAIEGGGVMVSENVKISLDISAVRQD